VEQPTFGAVTDTSGNFTIKGIEVGTYSLKATLIGYESIILTNMDQPLLHAKLEY
jgi:hypothetical protein